MVLTVSTCPPVTASLRTTDPGTTEQAAGEGTHLMTTADVEEMKLVMGVRDPAVNYNVVYGGYGTGYAPPTEEEYAAMVGQVAIRNNLYSASASPSSYDLSTDPCFPAVGDQAQVGSCAAWAMAYYCYGYLEAKDNGWTDASLGNKQHLLSPSWTYNKVNGGTDTGSWMGNVGDVLRTWGSATMSTMPYGGTGKDDSEFLYWGGEAAFREAPLHRALKVVEIDLDLSDWKGTLSNIRSVVSSGTPVTFAMNAGVLDSDNPGDKVVTSTEYIYGELNHAQTIVGYDDTKDTGGEVGAFKVVNSWGASFWGDGYYWITYDAFEKIGSKNQLVYITDRPDYQPSLLGVWHYASPQSQDGSITITALDGTTTVSPYYKFSTANFPSFLCLDISDLKAEYDAGRTTFQLTVLSGTTGTLSSFRTELYSEGYLPGRPTHVSTPSPDVSTSSITNVRSVLPSYPITTLATALDLSYLDFFTEGSAVWTPSVATSTKGSVSAQSGDVATSSRSWLNLTLEGTGTLSFDWRIDCPSTADSLTLRSAGTVKSALTTSTPWAHYSLDLVGPSTAISWTFLRQGNGGGCAWIDNVVWMKGDLHVDSDAQLDAAASSLHWAGSGVAGDPYIIEGYSIDHATTASEMYIGNTTRWLTVASCDLRGADQAGQAGLTLFKVSNAEVRGCVIAGNYQGIVLVDCAHIVLVGNNISANVEGLLIDSSQVTAYDNLFRSNTGLAVRSTGSPNCLYYENVFMGNNGSDANYDPDHPQAADGSAAVWDNTVGNYWSDLAGSDANGDGILDTYYSLGSTRDRYPTVSFVTEPQGVTAARSGARVTLDWSAPDRTDFAPVIRYEVSRVHGGATVSFSTVESGLLDIDVKTYGAYTYTVRAWTELGPGPWSPPSTVTIPDTVSPTIFISSPSPGAWLQAAVVTITWAGSDEGSGLDHYEVSVDGGAFRGVSMATSYSTPTLSVGSHQVTVRAFDRAGNKADSTITFNVDHTAPTILVRSPISGSVTGSSSVAISIAVSDAGSGYHRDLISIDGQLVKDSNNLNSISFTVELEDGVHHLTMTSTDRAGNVATVNFQFTVSKGAPNVAIYSPIEGSRRSTSDVTVEWNVSDPMGIERIELSVDEGSWTDVTGRSNLKLSGLANGGHVVALRATNERGRIATVWSNFTVDTVPLTASMEATEDVPRDGPLVITFSKAVDSSTLEWSMPFSGTLSWQGNDLTIVPSDRLGPGVEYSITVSINDLYGIGSGPIVLTFRTTDHGVVSGVVLDPSGNPVAGALVIAPDGSSVLTAQDGSFSLAVPPGPIQLTVHLEGYNDLTWAVDLMPGEESSIGSRQLTARQDLVQTIMPLAAVLLIIVAVLVIVAMARRRR
jgi:parallel beta-helix repeat protein